MAQLDFRATFDSGDFLSQLKTLKLKLNEGLVSVEDVKDVVDNTLEYFAFKRKYDDSGVTISLYPKEKFKKLVGLVE